MSEQRIVRVVIRGRVQGVGFRWWTAGQARDLGLGGWVRNRRDGTVEAVFRGSPAVVERMLAACREGPPSARVEAVEQHEATLEEAGQGGFEQLPTT